MAAAPAKTLLVSASGVGAATAVFPFVTGYGTDLFQIVIFGAWNIVAAITSSIYADTHPSLVWPLALALNLILYLIPATGILLATRRRWPALCSVAIAGWCVLYVASLFWLFRATDGP